MKLLNVLLSSSLLAVLANAGPIPDTAGYSVRELEPELDIRDFDMDGVAELFSREPIAPPIRPVSRPNGWKEILGAQTGPYKKGASPGYSVRELEPELDIRDFDMDAVAELSSREPAAPPIGFKGVRPNRFIDLLTSPPRPYKKGTSPGYSVRELEPELDIRNFDMDDAAELFSRESKIPANGLAGSRRPSLLTTIGGQGPQGPRRRPSAIIKTPWL